MMQNRNVITTLADATHREVCAAVGQVVPATQRRVVLTQVHLQVAEEVDVLAR